MKAVAPAFSLLAAIVPLLASACNRDDAPFSDEHETDARNLQAECGAAGEVDGGHCDCPDGSMPAANGNGSCITADFEHDAGEDKNDAGENESDADEDETSPAKDENDAGENRTSPAKDENDAGAGESDAGAGESDAGEDDCGGHGELRNGQCDCDEGFESNPADKASCLASVPATNGDAGDLVNNCDVQGNITASELPEHGSVAFVIVDGQYRFIKKAGMEDTSISFVDSRCEYAYGWSRDKPFDDDSARESSWRLKLSTLEFSDINVPGATWSVLRNGVDRGLVVGKAGIDNGTPGDPSDDESRAFIHDVSNGATQLIARDGFSDIGFTSLHGDVMVGFNDFGTQGFVYREGQFLDLDHADAFRLFPFKINGSGTIVGLWGREKESWYNNAINAAFVAEPDGTQYKVRRFELPGHSGTGLTGLNEAGAVAGLAYASPTSLPVIFGAESIDAEPTFYPLEDNLEPFPTGLSETGLIHGQVFLLAEPPACGGHGTPDNDTCICDDGYEVDTLDPRNCLPPDAACSGHGHMHGAYCHCDDGYEVDPTDGTKCVDSDAPKDSDPHPSGRLLVADGSEGRVVVVDLSLGEAVASLAVEGQARVYASADGQRGFAVQTAHDLVQGVAPGLRYVAHGDHYDVEEETPSVLSEVVVSCERPVHFVPSNGYSAAFCDGDGSLRVFEDPSAEPELQVTSYDSGRAHHGVGLVGFDRILLSMPNPENEEDALPIGVRALSWTGEEEAVFGTCPSLHGEAATAEHICFGCGDGVLCVAEDASGALQSVKVPNPPETVDGIRVGGFSATDSVLLGNWGDDLVIVDPDTATMTELTVGEAYLAFKVTADGQYAVVLTDSGQLHRIGLNDASRATIQLLPDFTRESGHGQLRPNLTLGSEFAYVVDPRAPRIHEVQLSGFETTTRTIELDPGEYHSLALVAVPPEPR